MIGCKQKETDNEQQEVQHSYEHHKSMFVKVED